MMVTTTYDIELLVYISQIPLELCIVNRGKDYDHGRQRQFSFFLFAYI